MLMKRFLVLAALLLTSTIAHAPAHAEFTLEQEQAFGTELNRLLKMQLKWALASGWRCLRV
jgi:hypothetical protein